MSFLPLQSGHLSRSASPRQRWWRLRSRSGIADTFTERDDADAIDESNIVGSRTRNAKPQEGYREPGDDEGLGDPEDGTSRGAAT